MYNASKFLRQCSFASRMFWELKHIVFIVPLIKRYIVIDRNESIQAVTFVIKLLLFGDQWGWLCWEIVLCSFLVAEEVIAVI